MQIGYDSTKHAILDPQVAAASFSVPGDLTLQSCEYMISFLEKMLADCLKQKEFLLCSKKHPCEHFCTIDTFCYKGGLYGVPPCTEVQLSYEFLYYPGYNGTLSTRRSIK
jgi:hypothetical protein